MNTICERCQAINSIIEENTTGEVVCTNCGLVYDDHLILDRHERTTFEVNGNQTKRVGPPETAQQATEPGSVLGLKGSGKTKIIKTHRKQTKEEKNCQKIQHVLSNAGIADSLIEKN